MHSNGTRVCATLSAKCKKIPWLGDESSRLEMTAPCCAS